MRKKYLYIVLFALLLTACSEQADFNQADVINAAVEQKDDPVNFGVYIGQNSATRAGAVGGQTTTQLQTNYFGVFAYNTGTNELTSGSTFSTYKPNFMYNQEVTWDGTNNVWIYTPVKYWPNGIDAANAENSPSNSATASAVQNLSFFAYAPYIGTNKVTLSATDYTFDNTEGRFKNGSNYYDTQDGASGILKLTSNNAEGDPKVTYALAVGGTVSNSVDLLWGTRGQNTYMETDNTPNSAAVGTTYNVNLTKQTVQERVKFLFKHALAKIGALKVVADVDDNSTTPTTTGSGSLDPATLITLTNITISDKSSTVNNKGDFDLATGTWGNLSTVSSGSAISTITNSTSNVNPKVWEPTTGTPPVVYTTDKWTTPDGGVLASELRDVYSTYDPILFIPGSAPQLTIAVTYIVRTYDAKLNASASGDEGTWSKVTQTITNDVTLPTLTPNTNYTLVMHLGLTSVKFSAEVADWDGGSTEVVWLPSNVVSTTATTLASGSTATVYTSKDAGTYTITVTGLTENATFTATSSDDTNAAVASTSPATGTSTQITVTLTGNSSTARSFTITITDTSADPDVVTSVIINQAAGS